MSALRFLPVPYLFQATAAGKLALQQFSPRQGKAYAWRFSFSLKDFKAL